MTTVQRRMLLAAPALLPLAMAGTATAATTDLALICDLALGRALRTAGQAFRASHGVRLHVFPTAPGLIVPQLARQVQIDLVATQSGFLQQAEQAGLLTAAPRAGIGSNAIVVAETSDAQGPTESGAVAVAELAGASGMEGAAIAAGLGIDKARIVSAIDTTEVAFLLTTGAARTGVLYLTDVRADPRLRVISAIKDQPPAPCFSAVTKGARRPDPAAFIAFLATPQARQVLASAGLEQPA